MGHERAYELSWVCPSCGSTATTRYCGDCGEESPADVPIRSGKTSLDPRRAFLTRVRASLRALASPPGRLTADWIGGKRVGYLTPLSLFLWTNVAFFLVQSASGLGILAWPLRAHLSDDAIGWLTARLLAHHRPDIAPSNEAYTALFDALEAVHAKSLVIVMVPVFAIALYALLADRRVPFKHWLTFAMHFFAFALIWLCALFPVAAFALHLILNGRTIKALRHSVDLVISALEAGVLGWYVYAALKTVLGLSWWRRLLTAIALIAALFVILKVYHVVVFVATLYST